MWVRSERIKKACRKTSGSAEKQGKEEFWKGEKNSLTAVLSHTSCNTLALSNINLAGTLLGTLLTTTAGVNDAFLDIRGEREEGLFDIDV